MLATGGGLTALRRVAARGVGHDSPTRTERQARTREELIDAAERLFAERGFDQTSLDAVADSAGYTKGAVYSNFASKEDLFFAVYERRVARHVAASERALEQLGTIEGVRRVAADVADRRRGDDGWLAVFLEFWTHVLRHPEHRARFAAVHAAAIEPLVAALEAIAADRGVRPGIGARQLAVAMFATQTGLSLERLTQPEVVGRDLAPQVLDLWLDIVAGPGEAPDDRRGASDGAAP